MSFRAFQAEGAVWPKLLFESCVDFEVAHLSILMVRRLPYLEIPIATLILFILVHVPFFAAVACLSWSLPSITEQQVCPHRLPMLYWLKNHWLDQALSLHTNLISNSAILCNSYVLLLSYLLISGTTINKKCWPPIPLLKIQQTSIEKDKLPTNCILVTINMSSLSTTIPHNEWRIKHFKITRTQPHYNRNHKSGKVIDIVRQTMSEFNESYKSKA